MSISKKKIVIDNSYYKKFLSAEELTIRNRLMRCETKADTVKIWDELFHPENTLGADGKPKLNRPLNTAEKKFIMKTLCRIDRVYLSMVLADGGKNLGLAPILNHDWVYQRCREVERQPDGHLDLWPRSHYKSTIITVHGIVQELLINPSLTVLVLTYTNRFGYDILGKIKKGLTNPILVDLFPDVLYSDPAKQAPAGGWMQNQIFIKGNQRGAFASVAFSSVEGGGKIGHHAQLLVYDDIVVESSVTTKENREKSLKAIEMSAALGSPGQDINRKQAVGTRYHKNDAYESLMESRQFIPRVYPATKNGQLDGEPVFMSMEEWKKDWLTKSDYVVACQMMQNPILSSDAIFDFKYLLPYNKLKGMNIFITVDYAVSKKSRSDFTSMAVIGMDENGTKYLLDGVRDKLDLEETWYNLKMLHEKWYEFLSAFSTNQYGVYVSYEKQSANRDIEALEMLMKRDDYYFEIVPYSSGTQSKVDKIKKLIIDFKNNTNGKSGGFKIPHVVSREGKYYKWNVVPHKDGGKHELVFVPTDKNEFHKKDESTNFQDIDKEALKVYPLTKNDYEDFEYDYTIEFLNEYENFPFSKNDDILDSIASIYSIPDISQFMGNLKKLSQKNLISQVENKYNY